MNRLVLHSLYLTWCFWLSIGSANAHGLPIGGLVPFVEAGEVVGAGTTWGIVLYEEGKWLRSCEEGTGATARFYHRTADGRVLVASDEGLFATSDGGCTYTAVSEDLSGKSIGAFRAARDAPERIFIATRTPGQQNGVFRSTDGGISFSATGLQREGVLFDGIIANGNGDTFLVHALDFATLENLVFVSRDGGETFEEAPAALSDFTYVRLLGTSTDGERLVVAALPAAGGNIVLESMDGFVSANEIARVDDEVTAFAQVGDVELLSVSGTRLLRRSLNETSFEQVSGPARCLTRVNGADALFACGALPDNAHILSTTDGISWEQHIPFLGVEERQCPEGTPGFDRCIQFNLPASDGPDAPRSAPPQTPDDAMGCNCIKAPSARSWARFAWVILLAGPLLWRRRQTTGRNT